MVKNLLLLLCVTFLSVTLANAQIGELNCGDSELNALCDIGEIDNVTFMNPPPGGGDIPNDALCTDGGTFHNPGWFSFVAGSVDISLLVTPLPMTCDTTPGGLTGVQVALWQGCPGAGGECVAGNADCNDTPISLDATDLIVGEIYNLTIDGCGGSVCEVGIELTSATEFALPDLSDVDLADPEYNLRGNCDNALGDGNFCAGIPINFAVDDEFYSTLGAEYSWSVTGPNIGSIEWEFGPFSGTGPDFVVGDLDGVLGANGINMIFPDPGTYIICLDNAATECDMEAEGEACTEINIIQPGEQNFGRVSVCALDLLVGWVPDFEDPNGNPWIAPPITLDQVESATDGILDIETEDGCGCNFNQVIQIDISGSIEREPVELFIWECMLPYTWFDEEFLDLSDLPIEGDFNIREGSAQSDYDGNVCDSLVSLTITPLTMIDTVIVGNCTPQGTEFTFVFTALDPFGNDVNINNPSIQWIDISNNTVVSTEFTALLESGSYFVEFLSSIQDLNYVDDDLAGIDPDAECAMQFGPFDLVGGSSTSPTIEPYQEIYCNASLDLLTFTIDTLPDTDYTWIIPPSYNVLFSSEDSLAVSIVTYVETDTLFVQASNGCGTSDSIPLPIEVTDGPDLAVNGAPNICDGLEFLVGYSGTASNIVSFIWDVPGGSITTGAADTPDIGITYPSSGSFMYTLTVEDSGGCTSSETFNVEVEALLENPVVSCDGDQTQIIFTWDDVPGATSYNIIEVDIPTGGIGTQSGNTYTITGVSANDQATIQVISVGSTSCIEAPQNSICSASSCDLSGVMIQEFSDDVICLGDPNNMPVQFEITLPSGFSGLYTGRGVDPFSGLFDPDSPEVIVGDNPVVFDFVDDTGACFGSFEIVITVNPEPNANITASQTDFCLGESITLSGVDMVATWDFGPDAVGDETNLSFSTVGSRTVLVSVEDPVTLCTNSSMIELTVNDTIEAPFIICTPGTDNVAFDWQDIVGASSFEVSISINGGTPIITTQPASDAIATGLSEGDMVDIVVVAMADNGCNMQRTEESCQARTCATPLISLSAAQQIFCSNDLLASPVNIEARVDGTAPPAGSFTFVGGGISVSGATTTFDPAGLTPGTYTATFTYTNPADMCQTVENINFEIVNVPIPLIVLNESEICIDQSATGSIPPEPSGITNDIFVSNGTNISFTGAQDFSLDFDMPGVFDFSLTYAVTNCPDITDLVQITVNDTIEAPLIVCASVDTDFIEFGWQDQTLVTEYEVYVDGTFDSTITDSEFRIDGLNSGDTRTIRVVAIDPICGNKESEFECMAQTCIEPIWSANIPAEQCYRIGSGPIVLDVNAVSIDPNSTGTLSWLESDVNSSNEFTPGAESEEYNFTAVFTEGNCTSLFPVTFTINVVPIAELSLSGPDVICVGSSVSVESAFSGTGNEVPMWNFDGGNEVGSGFGPYDVTFDTPGTYQIELFIDNEGCIGDSEMVEFVVEPELEQPMITCMSNDINSVSLSWDAVDCASEYIVYIDGVQTTTTSNLTFEVSGLSENQEITASIEAISECACNNITSLDVMCTSKPCDPTTWTFSANASDVVCLDVNAQTFTITASPNDLLGNGVGTWSGDPVSDAEAGLIDPALVSAGTYDVTYAYEEGGCTYTSPVIQLTFVDEPIVELTAMDPACPDDVVGFISAEGMGGAAGYMYAIDGGNLQPSGNFPDIEIGNHTVDVVDANGCVNSASIDIFAPNIPSVDILGAESVIIDNDAIYALNIQNADNIEDIVWTIDGTTVCSGSTCLDYNVISANADFVIGVTVIYDGGCMVSNELFVDVKEIQAFYIPNTVAFNTSDGENNQWKIFIKGSETFPLSIKIYDRWGNLMHEGDFVQNVVREVELWDGTSNDRDVASGVYVYVLQIQIEDRLETIGGDVTILR